MKHAALLHAKRYVLQNYRKFIHDNAECVAKTMQHAGSSQQVVSLTNDLAILVAAFAMLQD